MVFFQGPLSSLASAALWATVHASYLNSEMSFGHGVKLSPDINYIPNFQVIGKPDPPQLLSNRIILTPPAPGNQRGAVWSDRSLAHLEWAVDFDFRATGPERGSGNIQLWYVNNGKEAVGTSSIYTVGKFDGLAIVIDQYAGTAGFIRGFLNDGSVDYKSHHSVDSLAFGHCEYSYRNLGRPSKIAVRQTKDSFRVEFDGTLCFESDKIRLPTGNQLGITAASSEINPDSFEIFKLVVTTEYSTPDDATVMASNPPAADPKARAVPDSIPSFSDPVDEPASAIPVDAQFADLHNRLQAMMKHISALNRDVVTSQALAMERANTLEAKLTRSTDQLNSLAAMDRKMGEIAADVRQTKADLHNALDKHVAGLKTVVADTHRTLLGSIAASAPSVVGYILVVVGSQVLTVAAYLVYKRRKNAGPKKYL